MVRNPDPPTYSSRVVPFGSKNANRAPNTPQSGVNESPRLSTVPVSRCAIPPATTKSPEAPSWIGTPFWFCGGPDTDVVVPVAKLMSRCGPKKGPGPASANRVSVEIPSRLPTDAATRAKDGPAGGTGANVDAPTGC